MALASVNLLRTKPGLGKPEAGVGRGAAAASPRRGRGAARRRPRSSPPQFSRRLPPPSKALASVATPPRTSGRARFAERSGRTATRLHVPRHSESGCCPELVRRHDHAGRQAGHGGRRGHDVRDARHGDAQSGVPSDGDEPGIYTHAAPALVMVGHWGLSFNVTPHGARRSPSSSSTRPTDDGTAPAPARPSCPRGRLRRCRGCPPRGSVLG